MGIVKPQLPAQRVPPLEDRGGDTSLPPLLSRVWWLFLNALNVAVATVSDSLDATILTIPLKMQSTTQSKLAALGPTLVTGTLVEVTDYAHVLKWTGSAYVWGPGDTGSGMLMPFAAAPTGSGWHLCDGSAGVKYLKADGTTGTLTLPNTAGSAAYLKLGPAYTNVITAAVVPTVTSPTVTSAGTTGAGTANLGGPSSPQVLVAAGALVVSSGTHIHVDVGHAHPLTDPTVGTTTAALPGDPIANFSAPLWFRQ